MVFKKEFFMCLTINIVCCVGERVNYLSLPKGSSCTWDGMNGKCVYIHRCLSTVEDLKRRDYPAICSFEGKNVVICCTDCELVEDTRTMVNTSVGIFHKNGQKSRDHCLEYLRDLEYPCKYGFMAGLAKRKNIERKCYEYLQYAVGAAGGRDARRQEFLHMALLGYGEDVGTAHWVCGGSVISTKFILTAGHCISSALFGPVTYAALGILKRTDPKELWQTYRIKRILPHPGYKSPSKYNDIALLETTRGILFNDYVLPACLHHDSDEDDEAEATGWGALGHRGELADTLQTVSLERFDEAACTNQFPTHRHLLRGINHKTQMCYGHRQLGRDTCEGDSGGPLQTRAHMLCVNTIIGVTSYGSACGFPGNSGVYTKVKPYLPWIESIVWP